MMPVDSNNARRKICIIDIMTKTRLARIIDLLNYFRSKSTCIVYIQYVCKESTCAHKVMLALKCMHVHHKLNTLSLIRVLSLWMCITSCDITQEFNVMSHGIATLYKPIVAHGGKFFL